MSYYPEQLKAVLVYIEALNEADKKIDAIGSEYVPYLTPITLKDRDGVPYGTLRDEIGGSWSWHPDERAEPSDG